MIKLITNLERDYPDLTFKAGETFSWSPKTNSVLYVLHPTDPIIAEWSLLHEVGHGLLAHNDYVSDFELLSLEVEAWQKAKQIAASYNITIDDEHIENCLDTYRDWLYQRSTCPVCTTTSLQTDKHTYSCINCDTTWRVSSSRLCRPYRRKQKEVAV